jgi:glycosyltransferase involved in cell wall biosynthesis
LPASGTNRTAEPRTLEPQSLSIVVPLFCEEEGVAALCDALRRLAQHQDELGRELEIILIDDGSTDGTVTAIQANVPDGDTRWRLVRHPQNRGLTDALRTGTEAAKHDLVGWLDADLTYDPALLGGLAAAVDDGADVAWASCHHPDGRMEGVPPLRRLLSRGASRLYGLATGRREVHTFTCMVRVQRRVDALRTWPARLGFLGVTEQLLRTLAAGRRFHELPAVLRARRTGRSKMRILPVTRAHLGLIVAARRNFGASSR